MRLIMSKNVLHKVRRIGGALAENDLCAFLEAKGNGNRLAELVRKDKCRLVLAIEVATLAHERWKEIEALKAALVAERAKLARVVEAARDASIEHRHSDTGRIPAAMSRLAEALAALAIPDQM